MTSEPRLCSSPFPDSWISVVREGHGEGKMGSESLKSGMGAEGRDWGSVDFCSRYWGAGTLLGRPHFF